MNTYRNLIAKSTLRNLKSTSSILHLQKAAGLRMNGGVNRQLGLQMSRFSVKSNLANKIFESKPFVSDEPLKNPPPLSEANYDNPSFAVKRDLEPTKNKRRNFVLFLVASGLSWAIGLHYAFNYTKKTSSSVTAAIYVARQNETIRQTLGTNVDFPNMFTEVSGPVNNVKGIIDVKFDIVGSKGVKAKLYLKCHRADKKLNTWDTDEFYVVFSDGTKIELNL